LRSTTTGTADSFDLVFSPAKPTLDIIRTMHLCRTWCDGHRDRLGNIVGVERLDTRKDALVKNRDRARFFYDLIPDQTVVLDKAADLFQSAEYEPAPADWPRIALDLMLASMPNASKVSEHYAAGLIDSTMDDPEVWQGYKPGFSYPVIAQVVREIRRASTFVPAHAEFLQMCQKHRQLFRRWQADLLFLQTCATTPRQS
jgi:hypothetical protein